MSEKATLVGSWLAELGPRVVGPNTRISYTATAFGAYKFTVGSAVHHLDMVAAGLFTDVMQGEKLADMEWVGPSEFKDLDGDLIYADGVSKAGQLYFELNGGTGKWLKVKGRIYVEDIFTFNDGKRARAFESGQGDVTI